MLVSGRVELKKKENFLGHDIFEDPQGVKTQFRLEKMDVFGALLPRIQAIYCPAAANC